MKLVKLTLIAPRQGAREVGEQDAVRLLASGSWVRVVVEGRPTDNQRRQARFRERKRAQGARPIRVWLRPSIHKLLYESRRGNESMADVITRLLLAEAERQTQEIGADPPRET